MKRKGGRRKQHYSRASKIKVEQRERETQENNKVGQRKIEKESRKTTCREGE